MLLKKLPALRQRHRMRGHALDLFHRSARHRDQVVANAQQRFALDRNIVRQQQIVVFHHRTGQRVLDRNRPPHRRAFGDGAEDFQQIERTEKWLPQAQLSAAAS